MESIYESKKTSNEYNSFDVDLIQDEKVLSIYQTESNISLSCKYEDYRKISSISFNIDSNQGEVYSAFDKFYTDIINGNILGEDENLQSVQEKMQYEKSTSWYESLVQNSVITMLCDAYPIKCPNVLKIAKKDNEIILTFDKFDGELPKAPYCISINIRQSGSRIYDFCIPFNTLFKQLQTVEDKKETIKTLTKKFVDSFSLALDRSQTWNPRVKITRLIKVHFYVIMYLSRKLA